MEVAGRADLKADLLKDLERQRMHFNAFRGNPAIAETVLNEVLGSLDEAFEQLNTMPGRAGHALTQNDWLMTLRSRIAIPGGTCEFDPAVLPRLAAHPRGATPVRPERLDRELPAGGPGHDAADGPDARHRQAANVPWPPAASSSRPCPPGAPTIWCVCAWIRPQASSLKSPATACW